MDVGMAERVHDGPEARAGFVEPAAEAVTRRVRCKCDAERSADRWIEHPLREDVFLELANSDEMVEPLVVKLGATVILLRNDATRRALSVPKAQQRRKSSPWN